MSSSFTSSIEPNEFDMKKLIIVKATIPKSNLLDEVKIQFVAFTSDLLDKNSLVTQLASNSNNSTLKSLLLANPSKISLRRKSKKSGKYIDLENDTDFNNLKRSLTVKSHLKLIAELPPPSPEKVVKIIPTTATPSTTPPPSYSKESDISNLLKSIEEIFNNSEKSINFKKISNSISENLTNSDIFKNLSNLIELNLTKILKRIDELKLEQLNDSNTFKSSMGSPPSINSNYDHLYHSNIICDGCDLYIRGIRYKCVECYNIDLCSSCESKEVEMESHCKTHQLLKIKTLDSPKFSCPYPRTIVINDQISQSLEKENMELYDKIDDLESTLTVLQSDTSESMQKLKEENLKLSVSVGKLNSILSMIDTDGSKITNDDDKIELLVDLINKRAHATATIPPKGGPDFTFCLKKPSPRLLAFYLYNQGLESLFNPYLVLYTKDHIRHQFNITPNEFEIGSKRTLHVNLTDLSANETDFEHLFSHAEIITTTHFGESKTLAKSYEILSTHHIDLAPNSSQYRIPVVIGKFTAYVKQLTPDLMDVDNSERESSIAAPVPTPFELSRSSSPSAGNGYEYVIVEQHEEVVDDQAEDDGKADSSASISTLRLPVIESSVSLSPSEPFSSTVSTPSADNDEDDSSSATGSLVDAKESDSITDAGEAVNEDVDSLIEDYDILSNSEFEES